MAKQLHREGPENADPSTAQITLHVICGAQDDNSRRVQLIGSEQGIAD
jgi:hypothetical protein